jgi:serine/threonine-protein kinase
MPANSPAAFVHSLRAYEIVSGAQTDEIARTLQPRFADVRGLAQELVRRGHLTSFQTGRLLQDRSQDLVVGSYRLLDQLGEGGMGQVFKARHVPMDRVVALKLIQKDHLSQPEAVKRFFREARAAAHLSHPNIVLAHDAGKAGEAHFLAMEYVEGLDLARLVQQSGPLAVELACEFIRQAALGLQHAFEKGVVHRDIKPANLLVTKAGTNGAAVVKILDFGLARFESDTGARTVLTKLGRVVGTVDYISPEQADNARKADIRSDIYSLGCSLFYLLTGQAPFPGETGVERLSARIVGKPQSLRALRPEVPEPVEEEVLGKMLARDPAKRFQTPAEVAAALEAFSKPGKVKTRVLDSGSSQTAAAEETSGELVTAGKGRTGPAERNPFANLEEAARTSGYRSSPRLDAAKPGRGAARKMRLRGRLAIGVPAAAAVGLISISWMWFQQGGNDNPKHVPPTAQGPEQSRNKGGIPTAKYTTKPIEDGHKKTHEPPVPQLDDAWLKLVAVMPADKQVDAVVAKLKERNPGFDGAVKQTIENGVVTGLEFVTDDVMNLGPLRALPGLKWLKCGGSDWHRKGKLADLSPLKGMHLTVVNCFRTAVSDLSPLKGMHLTSLDCRTTAVSDLSPLKGMPLTFLGCGGTRVVDLSPLEGMP